MASGAAALNVDAAQRRLLQLVPSVRPHLTGAVAAGLAATLLLIAQMLLLSWILRDVLFRRADLNHVAGLVVLASCAVAGRAVLVALREIVARRAAIRFKLELRQRLTDHLLRLGPAYVNGERTGDLVATATDGIEQLDAYVSRYLPQTALAAAVPLVIVLAILPVDALSAGLLVFTVPVIVMLMVLIGTYTQDRVRRRWQALGRLSTAFLDIVQGLPTLLLLDRDDSERRHVEALSEQFRDRTLSVLKVAFISGAVLELMTAAGIGLVATVLGIRLLDGSISFDRAFYVFLLTPEFYRPLRDLGAYRHAGMESGAAAERILQILETPAVDDRHSPAYAPVRTVGSAAPSLSSLAGDAPTIELEDVSYRYPERERPALTHLTLSLPAGTSTAVVGRSGSGKTTLVNLLLRALEPADGVIRADGVPVDAMPLEVWRGHLALVPQRPYLFRGTVRDNIRLARPRACNRDVVHAAELAGCLPFIAELPGGFESIVGERGEGLSAGQRQRLAIARAFLKDAPLLVLDEPTSALDPESEAQIRQALALLMRDRTVLIVAHRRNTIKAAIRVAVLDGGRLADAGRHDEVLQRGGIYASLFGRRMTDAVPAAAGLVAVQ